MLVERDSMFTLSNEPGSLGLSCDNEGIALAGVPLLRRTETGFVPRAEAEIEQLIGSAYGNTDDHSSVFAGLGVAACALNAGDLVRAMIAAVQLKLPKLDWHGAVRIAQADEALAKYSRNQPRDWHGRWTTGDTGGGPAPSTPLVFVSDTSAATARPAGNGAAPSGADAPSDTHESTSPQAPEAHSDQSLELPKDWVHLPPGERNDELGDLLEWIANAKPEDAPAIRAEIKRQFYDKGDFVGGNIFNGALSGVLNNGPLDRETREELLARYEHYTHRDPALARVFDGIMGGLSLLGPRGAAQAARELPSAAEAITTVETAVASEVWKLGWAERGRQISKALGQNLVDNFPTIDIFSKEGIATSIKSIDLNAATYRNGARLLSRLNRYVDDVSQFNGAVWAKREIQAEEITGRALNVAIPKGSLSEAQRGAIEAAKERAKSLRVDLVITPF